MASATSLSRELILAKCKTDNLKLLKNLNLWGVGFEDVSLLNQMPNIEVLSLSINKISSLKDFQNCQKLQELYVRRNNIKNLAEIRYLQKLPYLRTLWLQENPCADHPNYRQYVISYLPNLQKLDNQEVTAEERSRALASGTPSLGTQEKDRDRDQPTTREAVQKSSPMYKRGGNDFERIDDRDEDEGMYAQPKAKNPYGLERGDDDPYGSRHSQQSQDKGMQLQRERQRTGSGYGQDTPKGPSYGQGEPQSRGMGYSQAHRPVSREEANERVQTGVRYNSYMPEEAPPSEAMRKKAKAAEVPRTQQQYIKNENVISAVLALLKELNIPELEFVKREVNSRIDEIREESPGEED